MESSSSPALPNQVVETYRRQEKRARIAGINVRPRAHCESPAADPNWRDWANLIAGPAGLIAERVLSIDVADYLRFRAVCSSWRRCTTSPHAHGGLDRRFHPRRWIMLPRILGALRKRREFMNVSTGERILVDLPELRYQYVFGLTSGGLIILCDKRTYDVHLFNPLTRQLTNLPNATTLKFRQVYSAGLADDSTVVLHFDQYWIFTAKPGDKHWTRLNLCYGNKYNTYKVMAALSFASRFYCVTEDAIMVVDTTADTPQLVLAAELGDGCDLKPYDRTVRLVDNDGELVLVHRIPCGNHTFAREGHKVHRVDLEAQITLPMEDLGGHALFVGDGYHGQAPAVLLPAGLSPYLRVDTVYSCTDYGDYYWRRYHNNLDDRPIMDVYRLPYGRIREDIGDAQSCGVLDYVSRYVCGSRIIVKQRRRSQRLEQRRRQLIAHQCNMTMSSQE